MSLIAGLVSFIKSVDDAGDVLPAELVEFLQYEGFRWDNFLKKWIYRCDLKHSVLYVNIHKVKIEVTVTKTTNGELAYEQSESFDITDIDSFKESYISLIDKLKEFFESDKKVVLSV